MRSSDGHPQKVMTCHGEGCDHCQVICTRFRCAGVRRVGRFTAGCWDSPELVSGQWSTHSRAPLAGTRSLGFGRISRARLGVLPVYLRHKRVPILDCPWRVRKRTNGHKLPFRLPTIHRE